jgi:hypothetical protein
MAQQKRGTAPKKRRTPSQKGRAAARKGRAALQALQERSTAEQRAFAVFDQQIDPLWDRLTNQCRQFAQGFNQEIGAHQLSVESIAAGLMVRSTTDGAEAFFQLDRTGRHVSVAMTTGCTNFGSCIRDQAPVGLTILGGQLRFLFRGQAVSEEELAVNILTDLLEADAPKASR